MSYADAAAKGPKQSPLEARAPAPPEIEHTDSPSTSSLIDVDSASVHTVPSDFGSQPVTTSTQAERLEREGEQAEARAAADAQALRAELARGEKEAKQGAKRRADELAANSDNPVVLGNAAALALLGAGLGFGAYRKYVRNELTWQVVGLWTGIVGAFAVGDFYFSQYLFKNKYPKK